MKRILLSVIALATAIIVLIDFFVDSPIVNQAGALLTEGAVVLAAFAMILGLLNLLFVHMARMRTKEPGWPYSAVLIVAVVVMLALGLGGPGSAPVTWVFRYVYSPLQATIFSLLAFFIVTAAYRAFRVKSWETALFAAAGLIVLIGQIPLAEKLWQQFPVLKEWVLVVPATAGMRGILLGVALGTILAGLRVLLLMDRPYLE